MNQEQQEQLKAYFRRFTKGSALTSWLAPFEKMAKQIKAHPEQFSNEDVEHAEWIETYARDAKARASRNDANQSDIEWAAINTGRVVLEAALIASPKGQELVRIALAEAQERGRETQRQRKQSDEQRAREIYAELKAAKPRLNALSAHPDVMERFDSEGRKAYSYSWFAEAIKKG